MWLILLTRKSRLLKNIVRFLRYGTKTDYITVYGWNIEEKIIQNKIDKTLEQLVLVFCSM